MTFHTNKSRQFLIEFIELYKSLPCLWKVKSAEYRDKEKKNKAYSKLVEKLKEIDESTNKDTVIKKIDSIRGCFRKELKKVRASERSGQGRENVYKPKLWYFESLYFLLDQEVPGKNVSDIESEDVSVNKTSRRVCRWLSMGYLSRELWLPLQYSSGPTTRQVCALFIYFHYCSRARYLQICITPPSENFLNVGSDDEIGDDSQFYEQSPMAELSDTTEEWAGSNMTPAFLRDTIKLPAKAKKRRKNLNLCGEVLKKIQKDLEGNKKPDDYDTVGQHFANKLRSLPKEVATVTEKLMTDVLFQAQMGNITRFTNVNIYDTRQIESTPSTPHSTGSISSTSTFHSP